jgi:hypothetical protein
MLKEKAVEPSTIIKMLPFNSKIINIHVSMEKYSTKPVNFEDKSIRK